MSVIILLKRFIEKWKYFTFWNE